MARFDKLSAHIRRWGWWRTIYALVMRAASKFLGIEVFIIRVRETPDEKLADPCELPGVTFRQISDKELMSLLKDPALFLTDDFVRPAIERGDLAFGAFQKGVLIAYTWRSLSSAPHYDDCWVRVASPYNYSYKSFTRPEFRGQHLIPALVEYSDHEMKKMGCTHRASFIAVTNYSSLAVGKYLGSEKIGYAGFVSGFGRYRFFYSAPVVEIGFQFFQPSPVSTGIH